MKYVKKRISKQFIKAFTMSLSYYQFTEERLTMFRESMKTPIPKKYFGYGASDSKSCQENIAKSQKRLTQKKEK